MTSAPPFQIRPLTANLDRTAFCSGSAALDRYLREQITQDVRRRVAACFVAEIAAHALMVDAKDEAAAAFYRHLGFIALPASPQLLFLPLGTVAAARALPPQH